MGVKILSRSCVEVVKTAFHPEDLRCWLPNNFYYTLVSFIALVSQLTLYNSSGVTRCYGGPPVQFPEFSLNY